MANPFEKLATQAKLRIERARSRFSLVDIVVSTFKRFSDTDGGSYAAALTYYTFFSIFPLLIFGAAILGYVTFGNAKLQNDIFEAVVGQFPMLEDVFEPNGFGFIQERREELALTGVVLALYSGSGAVVALEHALNKVHRIQDEPNFLEKRLRSLKWLAILGAAGVASVALTYLGEYAGDIFDSLAPVGGPLLGVFFRIAALALGIGVFATAYRFLPGKELSWRDVLPGAIVAAVLFELLKTVGRVWLASGAEGREATFGAFYAAAMLLVVCYLAAQVTILSAEVNAVLAERRMARGPAASDEGGEG